MYGALDGTIHRVIGMRFGENAAETKVLKHYRDVQKASDLNRNLYRYGVLRSYIGSLLPSNLSPNHPFKRPSCPRLTPRALGYPGITRLTPTRLVGAYRACNLKVIVPARAAGTC